MKKLKFIAPALLLLSITACRRGSHTIIATNANGYKTRLEYSGRISLNNAETYVESISEGGYLKYNQNGDELDVYPGNNHHISYSLNGTQTDSLDQNGRALLAGAIAIIRHQRGRH